VVVVRSTRTGAGRIAAPRRTTGGGNGNGGATATAATSNGQAQQTPQTQQPPNAFGMTVAAEDLSPIKSRILLMLALTKTANPDEVQRMFVEY
jgi:L-asparaginase/Glu-tRNA(Gln) amidotransferase subunit D